MPQPYDDVKMGLLRMSDAQCCGEGGFKKDYEVPLPHQLKCPQCGCKLWTTGVFKPEGVVQATA